MSSKIDWIKYSLITVIAICGFLLIREYDQFSQRKVEASRAEIHANEIVDSNSDIPQILESTDSLDIDVSTASNDENNIHINTNVLHVIIDLNGGDLVQADLLKHMESKDSNIPLRILDENNLYTYVTQSGLAGRNGFDSSDGRAQYTSQQTHYTLSENEDSLEVVLSTEKNGVQLDKIYTFRSDNYLIDIDFKVRNNSDADWQGTLFARTKRNDYRPETSAGFGMAPFLGAAITTDEKPYKKLSFDDMVETPIKQTNQSGWVAFLQHYFVTAWIASENTAIEYTLKKLDNGLFYMGYTQSGFRVKAGESGAIQTQFYIGPKDQYKLADIAEHLDLTVDYGWLWWAAQPLYWLLFNIQKLVVNWGIAIILLTLIVKAIFFPLSAKSYRSMAKMRKLAPKMQELKERYAGDRQGMSKATMEMYQKEKVNPMGGCLPMLIQMPIFIALYWVIFESVELRHAPFMLWIQDLSAKDPYFILPIFMGVSMYFQQKLNPAPTDPMQAKVMQFLPVMFTVMFIWFPSGLVLYWTVNNLLSMAQQYIITKKIENE